MQFLQVIFQTTPVFCILSIDTLHLLWYNIAIKEAYAVYLLHIHAYGMQGERRSIVWDLHSRKKY